MYAITYLAAPYVGIQDIVSSAGLVDTISMAPFWLKTTLKAPLALAASFHSFNGLRHLAWDWGYCEYCILKATDRYDCLALSVMSWEIMVGSKVTGTTRDERKPEEDSRESSLRLIGAWSETRDL